MTPTPSVGAEQVCAHLKAITESRDELLKALESCFGECERLCIGNVDLMRAAIKHAKAEASHV